MPCHRYRCVGWLAASEGTAPLIRDAWGVAFDSTTSAPIVCCQRRAAADDAIGEFDARDDEPASASARSEPAPSRSRFRPVVTLESCGCDDAAAAGSAGGWGWFREGSGTGGDGGEGRMSGAGSGGPPSIPTGFCCGKATPLAGATTASVKNANYVTHVS